MIPVYFKTSDFAEPEDSVYHLVTGDGLFLVRKTPLFNAIRSARGIPGCGGQSEALELGFPRLARGLMESIYGFFQSVYDRWEAEAIALLYYSPDQNEFRIAIPPQTIYRYQVRGYWHTQGRVQYGYCARPDGFLKLGDAHSHADLPAFHSCTDDEDDREDGLRIVLGSLHRRTPSVAVSFVACARRFQLEPSLVLEDFSSAAEPPASWMSRVTCEYERPASRRENVE